MWHVRPACQTFAFAIVYFGQDYQASVLREERVHTKGHRLRHVQYVLNALVFGGCDQFLACTLCASQMAEIGVTFAKM